MLFEEYAKGCLSTSGDLVISKELFDQCESVRLGAARASSMRYSEKPFIFRGLVKCATSHRTVTCDLKKDRHVYLICRDPSEPGKKLFVPESTVLDQVKSVFQSIQVPPKLVGALLAHNDILQGRQNGRLRLLASL
jgi:hypothetical protein